MADGEEFSRVSHLFIIPIFYFNFSQFHGGNLTDSDNVIPRNLTPEVLQALRAVRFIAQHIKDADKDNEVGTQRRSVPPPSPAYFCCPFLLTRGRVSSSRRCGEEAEVLGVVIVYIAIFSASGGSLLPPSPSFFFIIVYCP